MSELQESTHFTKIPNQIASYFREKNRKTCLKKQETIVDLYFLFLYYN